MSLGPGLSLNKAQYKIIRSKSNLKDYVYAIMGMVWTRDILCSHSSTGRTSNAYPEKEPKPKLDEENVKTICGKLIAVTLLYHACHEVQYYLALCLLELLPCQVKLTGVRQN